MSDDVPPATSQARVFGGVADAYDRGRPGYGEDAAVWLTGPQPLTVLELGAGTGKLTARLVALGHDVHATDPDAAMLARLTARLPDVRTSVASAEDLPAAAASYDVVVAAQCLHWFEAPVALAEIARVLKPGGTFSAVWNLRDERIPWVRKLGRIIGTQENLDSTGSLRDSELFDDVEEETFGQWQTVDRASIVDLVASRSNIAILDDAEREQRLAEVLALYDEYGRGMDGMQLPYRTECFRARVADVVEPEPEQPDPLPQQTEPIGPEGPAGAPPRVVAGEVDPPDDGVLLIDFR